ncbi:hypothetical protein [Nonomuraea jabiensis]|uniref:hypothetical protein n=1 Tax=Nonomuraea jabiensis TaxID=882448 RepID=UPI003D74397A
MTRFLIAWVTQVVVGRVVAPSARMRRLACSMTTGMYWRHEGDVERAALQLTAAVTRIADRSADAVPDELWDEVADHFDEKQLSAIN